MYIYIVHRLIESLSIAYRLARTPVSANLVDARYRAVRIDRLKSSRNLLQRATGCYSRSLETLRMFFINAKQYKRFRVVHRDDTSLFFFLLRAKKVTRKYDREIICIIPDIKSVTSHLKRFYSCVF